MYDVFIFGYLLLLVALFILLKHYCALVH